MSYDENRISDLIDVGLERRKELFDRFDKVILIEVLTNIAKLSTCKRSKCASIIVKDFEIIAEGYNSMPCNVDGQCFKDNLSSTFKSDKTCCVHAEQRAIMQGLKNGKDLTGSTLYFLRLDENDNPKHSGKPYCSICSKMALDAGISYFALWHETGWKHYGTKEYNDLTFRYSNNQ